MLQCRLDATQLLPSGWNCFPILNKALRARIIHEVFDIYLQDNLQAWELQADGSYVRCQPEEGATPIAAQSWLLQRLTHSLLV